MTPERKRVCYKQKLCYGCFVNQAAALIAASLEPAYICPRCGEGTVDDHEDVFLTYVVPGAPKSLSEMPLCPSCFALVTAAARNGATLMEDRQQGRLGADSGPQTDAGADPWANLGLRALP
jgi:hypothetical protein